MADLYTLVSEPNGWTEPGGEVAFGLYGRHTRAEAVQAARDHFEFEIERARRFLALHDDELLVRITRGWNVAKVVEVLTPSSDC